VTRPPWATTSPPGRRRPATTQGQRHSHDRNRRSATRHTRNPRGGPGILHHRDINPVLVRDWSIRVHLFTATVEASANTWKFRDAATRPMPRAGALDRPAVAAQPLRGLDAAPCDPWANTTPVQVGATAAMIVGLVSVDLAGATAAPSAGDHGPCRGCPVPMTRMGSAPAAHWVARPPRCRPEAWISCSRLRTGIPRPNRGVNVGRRPQGPASYRAGLRG
jgi:hypothetical protein